MKIAINVSYTPSGGSLTQILNMIKYFNQNENIDIIIYSKRKNISLLENVINNNNKVVLSWFANLSVIARIIWEQLFLPFYLKKDRIDLLFCPGNISPYFSPVKTIQWIGTIGPFYAEFYRNFNIFSKIKIFFNKYIMIASARKADAVIFESNYTQNLFVNKYNLNQQKSHVLHIGKDIFFRPTKSKNSHFSSKEKNINIFPYLLCVSHLYPYKNIINMIKAYSRALQVMVPKRYLVIAGSTKYKAYYNQILDTIKRLSLEDNIYFLGSVSKNTLRDLYSNCDMMIFPSPFENFAYTLVEAMSCGAPIVCSNTTAMQETCQDAAVYFEPYKIDDITEKIIMTITNKKLRISLQKKSLERVDDLLNYEEVTIELLDIMNNL